MSRAKKSLEWTSFYNLTSATVDMRSVNIYSSHDCRFHRGWSKCTMITMTLKNGFLLPQIYKIPQ